MKLLVSAVFKYIAGVLLVGAFVFLSAGTLNFPNGWLLMFLLFIPMLILGIILFIKSPDLLKKRLNVKEKMGTQRTVVAFSGLMFIFGFVLSALDFRFSLSHVPTWLIITASILFLLGYGLYFEVMRENRYLSRTVNVEENHKIIDRGLYGIVRHPMYFASILMFLPIPLILGSFWGLIPFSLYPVLIIFRINYEEGLLSLKLIGYNEYKRKVRYKLIPFIF
jgi:protein-S-isoprenylcysteine O-methyltransferase Ste14